MILTFLGIPSRYMMESRFRLLCELREEAIVAHDHDEAFRLNDALTALLDGWNEVFKPVHRQRMAA